MTDLRGKDPVAEKSQEKDFKGKAFRGGDLIVEGEPWVWTLEWKYTKSFCAHCFKQSASVRTCHGCQTYRYCDEKCQRADWKKEHKVECGLIKCIHTSWQKINPSLESVSQGTRELYTTMSSVMGIQKQVDSFYSVDVLLLLKIMNKVKRAVAENISLAGETKSSKTMLHIFRRNPCGENEETGRCPKPSFLEDIIKEACSGLPDSQPIISESDIEEILDKVRYNLLPITDYSEGQTRCIGAGLFPCVPKGETVAVCSDHNVAAVFQGKLLRMYAVEDIPDYTGLRDARLCDLTSCVLTWTSKQRRESFANAVGRACNCRKCTPEYDAEINLLRCTTKGCKGRIPSDERALLPCAQCRATNEGNLSKFVGLAKQSETLFRTCVMAGKSPMNQILNSRPDNSRKRQKVPGGMARILFKQWNEADVLQPGGHLRFAIGWNVAEDYYEEYQYEEAWEIYREMIICIRALYPEYHPHRAEFLRDVAQCPLTWWTFMLRMGHAMSPMERKGTELLIANAMMQDGMDCLKESLEIYSKLYGKDSTAVLDVIERLEAGRKILVKVVGKSFKTSSNNAASMVDGIFW